MAIIALLPIALLSVVNLLDIARSQRAELQRTAVETARALSIAVDKEISTSIAAAEILGASPALVRGDLKAFYEEARGAIGRRAAWENVVVYDPSGQQLMNLRAAFGAPLPRAVDWESVAQVVRERRAVVTNVLTTPILQDRRFVVRVPVFQGDRVRYVLTVGAPPDHMRALLMRQKLAGDAVASVIDRNGKIVARSRGGENLTGTPVSATLLEMLATGAPEGFGTTKTLEGTEVYTAYSRSQETGWGVAMGLPRATIDGPVRRSYAILGGAVVLSLLLGVWAALLVAGTVIHPITALREMARRIRGGGAPEVPRTTIPELRETAETLLQAHLERERLLTRERELRNEAQSASRAKDEFLAMLGHELRNPLAAITSAVAVLRQSGGIAKSIGREAADIVDRQSRHLARIVDDLLDVVRVMTGKIMLKMEALDLAATVQQAVSTLSAGGVLQRHRVEVRLSAASVRGDESRVEQIVTNLLTNAGKYTPPGGTITVTLEERDGQAILRVRDTGLGLDKDLLPIVFDLFVQGGRTLDRSQGGLGIGLSLVKRLVELHGGTISARSDGAGKGSEFEVRLPAIAGPLPAGKAPALEAVPSRNVLIVEDNDDAREMLKIMLELSGHQVHTASDGNAGVAAALATRPHIALVDIGLPGLNGYEVAREIRGRFEGPIRLVALTGYGMPDDEIRAREAGFDEHLIKPVDWQQLTRVLARELPGTKSA